MLVPMVLSALLAALSTLQESSAPAPEVARGLRKAEAAASPGFVFFGPLRSHTTFLIDARGETVHSWESANPGGQVSLLDDGSIVRASRIDGNPTFYGGGLGGRIERIAKDGTVMWDYVLSNERQCLHHGFDVLPNGNILCIAWERLEPEQAIALGRDPAVVEEPGLWSDWIFELRPPSPADHSAAEIVWEWHAKDHLIQDFDPTKPNHGPVAEHPERLDVNGDHRNSAPLTPEQIAEMEALEAEMRALGYAGGEEKDAAEAQPQPAGAKPDAPPAEARRERKDWLHTNSVDHDPATDLLLLSVPRLNEIWVIDHSTTTAEARGSTGGRWKKGGDLLYRWGNPAVYRAGTPADQQLFFQHQPEWVAPGFPGAGHVLLFNNGRKRAPKEYSTIDELALPFDASRGFTREPGKAFGPAAPLWSYSDPENFYSHFISGCQRLANGNTFVCSGKQGRFFEVTPAGAIVWEYWNPHGGEIERTVRPGEPPSPVEPKSCFRAEKIAPDHPALEALGIGE
jgi:hypothetical protein